MTGSGLVLLIGLQGKFAATANSALLLHGEQIYFVEKNIAFKIRVLIFCQSSGLYTLGRSFAISAKGDHFCAFLFGSC